MLQRFRQLARRRGRLLHDAEGGAIILLVLAGFLILTLASLTMYDAGQTAHEEVQVQTAADSAAYSQSVVKARSMNKIAYANTAKRMFFGYFVTYVSGLVALVTSTGEYASKCNPLNPATWWYCYRATVGGFQVLAELINYYSNVYSAEQRAADEIETLNDFQGYLDEITPWWGYMENLKRGHYNGATATTAWPTPPATIPTAYQNLIDEVMDIDDTFDTSFAEYFPDPSDDKEDALPIQQRDPGGMMDAAGELGDYCAEFLLSPEHLIPAVEHMARSDGGGGTFAGISADTQTLTRHFPVQVINPMNCAFVATNPIPSEFPFAVLGSSVMEDLADYRVDEGGFMPGPLDENEWMQRTSNITLAYKATQRSGDRRNKFDGILRDHDESPAYQSDGTWSVARSEVVWGESIAQGVIGDLVPGGLSDFPGINAASNMLAGPAVAARGGPHMWAPRWTSKLRPVYLPGEDLGETKIHGNPIGLDTIFIDSLPHMAITATVSGVLDGEFDFFSAVDDLFFMYAASGGLSGEHMEGIEK